MQIEEFIMQINGKNIEHVAVLTDDKSAGEKVERSARL